MKFIAGDIGGTKSWLALFDLGADGELELLYEQRYPSNDFPSVTALLSCFLHEASTTRTPIERAVLALPGPINDGRCRLTNIDWTADSLELEREFSIPQVTLTNDFQAACSGITTLDDRDLITLNNAPALPHEIRVVTGAGTGLGLAWMQWQGDSYHTQATEGGHIDFAPATPLQLELWQFLKQGLPRVSYENVLCGHGLESIYEFILSRDSGNYSEESPKLDAPAISALANTGHAGAVAALQLFVEIYGNWIGNLALLYRPFGGLYIAGGIAAKTVAWMRAEKFTNACYNKGKMSKLVKQTPIYLITNERLGLQGAIEIALGPKR